MNGYRIATAAALLTAAIAACDQNSVQQLPVEPLLGSRIKFFNFGVNAPGVNFYADQTKMTAILSGTGSEATTGVTYGAVGNGGAYSQIAPGSHTLTGRIAAATDKDLPIATVNATIDDAKYYSFYMTGFYNTTTKTSDAFVLEDPVAPPTDYAVAYIRFVNTISNATHPLILYAQYTVGDTTRVDTLSAGVAYKGVSAFATLPVGIYNLLARYIDSTTNKFRRDAVTFLGGRLYTVGARGDITITSTTATNRPFLDNTANR
ncbi:MAG TPA: DUF4397 domain-containing protein [Gemmatimonadales bacterium]|jgi:hypothetical protein